MNSLLAWLAENPEIFAAVILLVGWLLALLLRAGVGYFVDVANKIRSDVATLSGGLINLTTRGRFQFGTFWIVILVAVLLALQRLGFGQVASSIQSFASFLPSLLLALATLACAHIVGLLFKGLLEGLESHRRYPQLARMVYGLVMLVAALMAIGQLGFNISFLSNLFLMLVGLFIGTLGLSFAFGAKELVANLSAQGEISEYKVGDRLSIDGQSGTVVEIRKTSLLLANDEGLVSIPAHMFAVHPAVLLVDQASDDSN